MSPPTDPAPPERVLGEYGCGTPGLLLFVIGGMHGNEPAGVRAARRVLEALETKRPPLKGDVVALVGNRAALAQEVRYVERDLNRAWWGDDLVRMQAAGTPRYHGELGELQELYAELESRIRGRPGPAAFLDLHSTSAEGAPFAIMSDTLQNREVAFALGIPVLLGIEELIEGTLLSYVGARGHVALGIEGGQHAAASTSAHLEAAVWVSLVAARMLRPEDAPVDIAEQRRLLRKGSNGLPRAVEIRHRHGVRSGEGFVMEPGYVNFQRIRQGELLARSGENGVGEVRSPLDGLLLMPRYQGQGEDGFFVGRELRSFWLGLSAVFRRARVHRFLHLLPGIRRDPRDPQVLLANRRVARWLTIQLFHLFGYRMNRRRGTELVFVRRPDRF